jgi:hypothetical protein
VVGFGVLASQLEAVVCGLQSKAVAVRAHFNAVTHSGVACLGIGHDFLRKRNDFLTTSLHPERPE